MTAQEFKAYRLKLGMTQREVARHLCVTPVAVHYWESGRNPIPEMASKLFCLIFGFSYRPSSSEPDYSDVPDLPFDAS
jgi:DNA-binding transcriptional regulator YiaG